MWPQNVSANVNEICGSPVPGLVEKIDFWWRAGRFVSCRSDPMETSPCWGLQAGISSFGWAAAVATGCTIWKRSWRPPCVPVWDVMSWNNSTYSRESDPIPGSNPVSLLNLLAARLGFFSIPQKVIFGRLFVFHNEWKYFSSEKRILKNMLRSSHWHREKAGRNISLFLITQLIPVNYTKALYVINVQEQYLNLKVGRED